MLPRVERIEHLRCVLEPGDEIPGPDEPTRTWIAEAIPPAALEAIGEEKILELPESLGERDLAEPAEYERTRIVTADGVKEIVVFNRGIMLFQGDESAQRFHRFAMKLGVFDED
jgi:hypothetical protein